MLELGPWKRPLEAGPLGLAYLEAGPLGLAYLEAGPLGLAYRRAALQGSNLPRTRPPRLGQPGSTRSPNAGVDAPAPSLQRFIGCVGDSAAALKGRPPEAGRAEAPPSKGRPPEAAAGGRAFRPGAPGGRAFRPGAPGGRAFRPGAPGGRAFRPGVSKGRPPECCSRAANATLRAAADERENLLS